MVEPGPVRRRKLAIVGGYSDHDLYQRNRTLVELFESLSPQALKIRPERRADSHVFGATQPLFLRLRHVLTDAMTIWTQRGKLADVDVIFVPYPAYADIIWLWCFGQLRGKKLIVDAFLDLHNTVVADRGLIPANSLRARMLRALQRITLGRADVVLIDTPQQAELLRGELRQRNRNIDVVPVPVGIDERLWTPLPMPAQRPRSTVLFWGTFIPLHGAQVIIQAARILAERDAPIDFRLIGDGQDADRCAQALQREPLRTLTWDRQLVETTSLREAVAGADIVLGIFGTSVKAASVVPYKVHQALASDRPVITRCSPAVDAALDPEAGFVGCDSGDPVALADSIQALLQRLHSGWRPATRALYDEHYGNAVVRRQLAAVLEARTEIA